MRTTYDRATAPTEILATREHHRIATLGHNRLIRDYYKTQTLKGNERVTRLLPRKRSFWRSFFALIAEKTKRAVIFK